MFNIFFGLIIIGLVSFSINLFFKIKGDKKNDIFDLIVNSLFNKMTIVCFSGAIVIYSIFSLSPYYASQSDLYLIDAYNKNIVLYQGYVDEYTSSAQKQIEEYQAAQSQMARTATAVQMQFWSQQIDAIGNSITNKIKEFNDMIVEQKVAINNAQSRIEGRERNKFFFLIK